MCLAQSSYKSCQLSLVFFHVLTEKNAQFDGVIAYRDSEGERATYDFLDRAPGGVKEACLVPSSVELHKNAVHFS